MSFRIRKAPQTVRLVVAIAFASGMAFANQTPKLPASATPLCYCNCHHAGSRMCTMMCELPQYQNRWWATSCNKKTATPVTPAAPESPDSHSRKTNHTEEAQLR